MEDGMNEATKAVRFATAEKIGRSSTPGSRRVAKRELAKSRRRNERRAIAIGAWDLLPTRRRDFLCGYDD